MEMSKFQLPFSGKKENVVPDCKYLSQDRAEVSMMSTHVLHEAAAAYCECLLTK